MSMTPQQIDALHELNDFLSQTLMILRGKQTRLTHLLATVDRDFSYEGTDLERIATLLSMRKIPYVLIPYEDAPEWIDLRITTAFDAQDADTGADIINIEFRFNDEGVLTGLHTLLGKAVGEDDE